MTRRNSLLLCAFCLLATILPGCGGATSEVPELAPVSGTVTVDGEPAAGVTVIFTPSDNPDNPSERTGGTGAFGGTDENGKYTLIHRSGQPGLQPGVYAVTFSKIALPDGSPVPEGKDPVEVGASEVLPERYTIVDPEKDAEHVATVEKEGGTFDFALKSK